MKRLSLCNKHYTIKDVIGHGSFGTVYTTIANNDGKAYAVKAFYSSRSFVNETTILRRLHHPHIISLRASSYQARFTRSLFCCLSFTTVAPALCMDIALTDVRNFISRHGKFSDNAAVGLLKQLANAVSFCHNQGIYHRDIKLANLLISTSYKLLLCDFGCATTRKLCRRRAGSYPYMAPELLLNEIDLYDPEKADIWSIGVCFFEMLTDRFPFQGFTGKDPYYHLFKRNDWRTLYSVWQLPPSERVSIYLVHLFYLRSIEGDISRPNDNDDMELKKRLLTF